MASIEDSLVICVGMDSVHQTIAYSNTKYRLESFEFSEGGVQAFGTLLG